jgi:tRNA U54 and U55 pseudouridine synthase Pus10
LRQPAVLAACAGIAETATAAATVTAAPIIRTRFFITVRTAQIYGRIIKIARKIPQSTYPVKRR